MGIAFAAVGSGVNAGWNLVLAPLQAMVSFFAPWQRGQQAGRAPAANATVFVAPQQGLAMTSAPNDSKARPLRVLRVLDSQSPRHSAGRMVISGRMADVCAELDRLAQQELA